MKYSKKATAYTFGGFACLVILLAIASVSLQGCSTSPEVPPQVRQETNLAQGYVLLAQVRLAAADAVKKKLLSPDEGRHVLQGTDTARQTLDHARDAHFNGVEGAAEKGWQIAEVILRTLQNDIQAAITARKEKAPK